MPDKKKIKELMVPITDYPVVYDTDTLKDALKILKNHLDEGRSHRSLAVFSKTRKIGKEEELVGILTVRDILNAIKRNRMCYDSTELFRESWASFYHKNPLAECLVTNVGKVTRPLVEAFVQTEDDVKKAIELMMMKNVNILPVFEDKKAVGVIRAVDILEYVGEMV